MNQHPLIESLKAAGPLTAKVAHTLSIPAYNPTGIAAVGWLADALIEDMTGKSALNDRWIAEDRDASREARKEARERTEQRRKIALALDKLPEQDRMRLYRELAAGNGAREAESLQVAADGVLRSSPPAASAVAVS